MKTTIALDAGDLLKAMASITQPGSVWLPVPAVQQLYLRHGITWGQLEACGAMIVPGPEDGVV